MSEVVVLVFGIEFEGDFQFGSLGWLDGFLQAEGGGVVPVDGFARPDRPAGARVVVQGARNLEGSLLVGGLSTLYLEGNELVHRRVSQLEPDVGEHEVSAVGTGQSALGHLRMADGFQLESGDLVLAERVDDPVLVGVRVGALGVDQAAIQNFEGLGLGLGRAGSEASSWLWVAL